MGGSKYCGGILQEAVILRWKDKIDDVSIQLSQVGSHQVESHSMCLVRSETVHSGWIGIEIMYGL